MEGLSIARRYAQSLMEVSEENKSTEVVLEDMKSILNAANENREFLSFLRSPLIKEDKKTSVFDKIFGDSHEVSKKFSHLLIKNKREYLLPLIAKEFIAKINEKNGITSIQLTSAYSLTEDVRQGIIDKLSKAIKGTLVLEEAIDESLIGGFVVRMGDTNIDASVAHQLNKMKQSILN